MPIEESLTDDGVLELVLQSPPVNAFSIGDLQQLAEILRGVELREEVRVVLFRSQGRGFCGGGDLKEVQSLGGFEGILGQTRGSYETSLAIAECAVPVIVAVHRYCIGVGMLLVGAADVILADDSAVFVLAEIDNGATSGAIQAASLMPEKRLRSAMYTCEPVPARELLAYGSLHCVVPLDDLIAEARALAKRIAAKPPSVVRMTKKSIYNSIARDIRKGYRIELSYTYELNLMGDAFEERQSFLDGLRDGYLYYPDGVEV